MKGDSAFLDPEELADIQLATINIERLLPLCESMQQACYEVLNRAQKKPSMTSAGFEAEVKEFKKVSKQTRGVLLAVQNILERHFP